MGNDYFCDTGIETDFSQISIDSFFNTLHDDNPLWDGEECATESTCCSPKTLPYFIK